MNGAAEMKKKCLQHTQRGDPLHGKVLSGSGKKSMDHGIENAMGQL